MFARLAIAAILFLRAAPAEGQETSGTLRGRLTMDGGSPVPGATISISGPAMQGSRLLRLNDDGYFAAQALPPGLYRAHVRALGFRELIVENISVRLGETTSLGDVVLRRFEVVLEPVVIRRNAASIDPLSTEVASRIDRTFAERLPIGRDYASIVLLLPQASESYHNRDGLNIAGSTGLENAYFIDGINVTEGFRNSGGINLPHSFIDHVELKTGGYEPEFGRALGGIVSATTRSGGNTHSMSAFAYYTAGPPASSVARANRDFANGRYARYDAGISAGGPIIHDRLWYFAAYDAGFAREKLRMPGGTLHDRGRTDQFAGKLKWRADQRTDLTATIIGDPSHRDVVGNVFWGDLPIRSLTNPDPYLGYWDQGSVAAAVTASRIIGRRSLLEARLSHTMSLDRTGPRTARGTTDPLVIDFLSGEWSGGVGNQWDRRGTRTGLSLAGSFERGPHTVKIGAQYEDNRQNESWQWIGNGPDGAGVILRTGSAEYLGLLLDLRTRVRTQVPTLFAQTSILAHSRLRLNGGLRWDAQYFSSATTGRSGSITRQIQPRLGVIVYPTGSETQKVTASVGRFYEQVPSQPITWFWGGLHQHFYVYDHNPLSDPSGGSPIFWDDVPAAGIRGQHYDEVTAGYEAGLPFSARLSVRASRRRLREVLQEMPFRGSPPQAVLANPGRGEFAALPRPDSRYDAFEVALARSTNEDAAFAVSYVVSRKFGNYVGLFDQDVDNPNPHAGGVTNNTGLLPNDRTHVVKTMGSYRVRPSLAVGGTFSVMSGTPLSEFGKTGPDPIAQYFLSRRGTAGRTPTVWDLNLRGIYDVRGFRFATGSRLVVDLLHAFSQGRPLKVDQVRYLSVDAAGNPASPNPFYRSGLYFQPPMTVRVGVEIGR